MVSKGKRGLEKKTKSEFHEKKETDEMLLNNFIALQKVMVNLAVKIDSLSNQISKLLELFEISAKSLAKKDFEQESKSNESKKILEKLDVISQQTGLIGKGLALIHEMNSERKTEPILEMPKPSFQKNPFNYPKSSPPNFSKIEKNIFSREI